MVNQKLTIFFIFALSSHRIRNNIQNTIQLSKNDSYFIFISVFFQELLTRTFLYQQEFPVFVLIGNSRIDRNKTSVRLDPDNMANRGQNLENLELSLKPKKYHWRVDDR